MRDFSEPWEVNFGCLPPLPAGYVVKWHPLLEMYIGHGPGERDTPCCWNRFWVRQWLLDASKGTPND